MKKRNYSNILAIVILISALPFLSGCGYNTIQINDEKVKSAWSEVLNQYKRRFDLIPNFVNTVKGAAAHEKETLIAVTEARAKVGTIQATPELLNNPQAFDQFQKAQGGLSSALSRLMVVVEKYPELRANQNFLDLQSQLEGTENRIAVARKRYIESVETYNIGIRTFPNNLTAMMFGYTVKPNFAVENEQQITAPPEVKF